MATTGSLAPDMYRVYRARRTVLKMLKNRGFAVRETEVDMTVMEFEEKFGASPAREDLAVLASRPEDPTDVIFVFFPKSDGKKIGIKPIKLVIDRLALDHANRAILVLQAGITPLAAQTLQETESRGYTIEHFNESELQVDITEHKLVPKHVVLTPAEKEQLLRRYDLRDSQLPRIQRGDPVARYFGLSRGQVVKIIRPSETAGRYVTYRLVE